MYYQSNFLLAMENFVLAWTHCVYLSWEGVNHILLLEALLEMERLVSCLNCRKTIFYKIFCNFSWETGCVTLDLCLLNCKKICTPPSNRNEEKILYMLTECFRRSIYPKKEIRGEGNGEFQEKQKTHYNCNSLFVSWLGSSLRLYFDWIIVLPRAWISQ